MIPIERLRANGRAMGVMLLAVCLQVGGAVLLKVLADSRETLSVGLILLGIGAVLSVNVLRLGVWGLAHSRFPLSSTFPLSSLFYPAMLGVAVWFGDDIGAQQVVGALLIASGSVWLTLRVDQ